MKKIYYWSPCLANIGTVKSTINSCLALSKYNHQNFNVVLINSCGEWDSYREIFNKKKIEIFDLNFKYFNLLPKNGFFWSRLSYMIIFLLSYFPLKKIINKNKPDFIIIHLVTSLPIIINLFNNFKTKLILRISGFPKLNFFRKNLWRLASKKIDYVTSPTKDLIEQLSYLNLFDQKKLYFLPDAIIDTKLIKQNQIQNEIIHNRMDIDRYYMSAGRLTKQKNFSYLIYEFKKFLNDYPKEKLFIFGDGEERIKLSKIIKEEKIENSVFLMGHTKNIHFYMKNANTFILSSLWEDPGFVLVEAAYSNLFIISSNCKNGPREILSNGNGGLLFNNNKKDALSIKLIKQKLIKDTERKKMKIISKRNSKKYSLFQHYLKLQKLLS